MSEMRIISPVIGKTTNTPISSFGRHFISSGESKSARVMHLFIFFINSILVFHLFSDY